MTPEEWKERVDAFTCYHWIIFHVEPTIERLYLGNLTIPSYIKNQVEKLKETPDDVFYYRGFFLSSASIHQILINLIEKDIPLFKVGNKEISCITDIKRLWDETKLSDFFLIPKPRSERYSQIKAYLLPQILEIKKHFQAIKPEKQDTPVSTPQTTQGSAPETMFNWSTDNDKQEVYCNGKLIVVLSNKPFKLFCCLYKKRGKFVYNKTLMNAGSYALKEYDKSFVDMMIKLENTLKKRLDKQGLAIKGKVLEKKRDNKRRNIAYKLIT